jgi:hypothetical protein
MITEAQLRTAIVQTIQAADAAARVHRRRRYPQQNRLAEYTRLFREAESGLINGWMVRRLRRAPALHGIPQRLVSVTFDFGVRFYYSLIESDDDAVASEEAAQLKIETVAAQFEADATLGLGPTVQHSGLEMPTDFEDVILGDSACHRADLRIAITVRNVTC